MGHPYGSAPRTSDRAGRTDPGIAPPRRWTRAGASAVAATALGLAGHVAAGGEPTLTGAALAFLVVALPSWSLAGCERGWTTIAAVQIGAQQVVHPLLVASSAVAVPAALPHDLMFFLHVLGALLMAGWLRVGERRLWAAARRFAEHLARWRRGLFDAPPAPPPRAPRLRPVTVVAPVLTEPLRHTLRRRGPPLPA
ncbi:MAG: hypothetical protein ACT4RN_01170 [Pseudonocardia sp.]